MPLMKTLHLLLYAGLASAALADSAVASIEQDAARATSFLRSLPKTLAGKSTSEDQLSDSEITLLKKEFDGAEAIAKEGDDETMPPPAAVAEMESAVTELVVHSGTQAGMSMSIANLKELINKTMLPKVLKAHEANQAELTKLAKMIGGCDGAMNVTMKTANKQKARYLSSSPLHKQCRVREAVLSTEAESCGGRVKHEKEIMKLKCDAVDVYERSWGGQAKNSEVVKKADGETPAVYMQRLHLTYCASELANGGSFYDMYLDLQKACADAKKRFHEKQRTCLNTKRGYKKKQQECDSIQTQMDGAACNRAILVKDSCEKYASCFSNKKMLFMRTKKVVTKAVEDRKAEWRALKRMQCLINAFKGGKVKKEDVDACKAKTHDTSHLEIKFPKVAKPKTCIIPDSYPATAKYKLAEFAPLPALAKGKADAYACHGVDEINVEPKAGSPKSCKCERIVLNGPFSPGPLVKCTECLTVSKSVDRDSCPDGTKIFSPRNRRDWKTFLASADAVRAPNFIMDITRPKNGCGGCDKGSMNSGNSEQSSWVTKDGSAWWLRSTTQKMKGNYLANCYMDLWPAKKTPTSANDMSFKVDECQYSSHSYYCQKKILSTKPKRGSPPGCQCSQVELTGRYSPGVLVKCTGCLKVKRSTEKDSCPEGMKIFSPRSREDWKTLLNSVTPLRSPHWIVDVTRPQNGCGGCTKAAMNFEVPDQATWRTQDGSPWWLRSTTYNEPNGDYTANCYMDLWKTPGGPNSITFNDARCRYHSDSYYCQPRQAAPR